jgi:hypoxanthine phosphoribosyltransferase
LFAFSTAENQHYKQNSGSMTLYAIYHGHLCDIGHDLGITMASKRCFNDESERRILSNAVDTLAAVKTDSTSILISESAIQQRVAEMASRISEDYRGRTLTVVGILKGSFIFIADLIRQIDTSIAIEVEFMTVSSYGNATTSSGLVRVEQDTQGPLQGRDVLLVEDIVDSGITINAVRDLLAAKNPRSLRIATLLEKQTDAVHSLKLDYVGFQIPNVFVVGYGLDVAQRYRNLKEIRVLSAG